MAKLQPFVFGKNPLCNRDPSKAPHIGGFCLPVCWRCMGGIIGATLAFFCFAHLPYWLCGAPISWLLLACPAVVHYLYGAVYHRKLRNTVRLVTGIFLGVAEMNMLLSLALALQTG